jgi:hypothetical protein
MEPNGTSKRPMCAAYCTSCGSTFQDDLQWAPVSRGWLLGSSTAPAGFRLILMMLPVIAGRKSKERFRSCTACQQRARQIRACALGLLAVGVVIILVAVFEDFVGWRVNQLVCVGFGAVLTIGAAIQVIRAAMMFPVLFRRPIGSDSMWMIFQSPPSAKRHNDETTADGTRVG